MEDDLLANLPPTPASWRYWPAGWLPEPCKTLTIEQNQNPADYTVFNVSYTDVSLQPAQIMIMLTNRHSVTSHGCSAGIRKPTPPRQ